MKKLTILVMMMVLVIPVVFGQNDGEIVVPLSNPEKRAKLTVAIHVGSIVVKGTNRKDVKVIYSSGVDDDKDDGEMVNGMRKISSQAVDMEISEKNNQIDIESDSWSTRLDLTIEVPSNIDLKLETYNEGDILIQGIKGEIDTDNYNGAITAEDIDGSLVAVSYNGAIKANFNSITPDTPMAFTTYNGVVDLSFPSGLKCSVKMKTSTGEIYTGFDMKVNKNQPVTKSEKQSGTYKVYLENWVRGDINGGGPEFMIQSHNGDIFLRKK